MPAVEKLSDLERRPPEAGRIRLGVKTERAMKAIDTFRFTSPYQDQIEMLAQLYGGTAKPWSDQRARIQDQFEVLTEATEIPVFFTSAGLSQQYEVWSGGGRQRACDGEWCEIAGREDTERVPCICLAKQVAECKLHTRLNVFIPELPFRGAWRLETKGWNAGHELPGMHDLVVALTQSGNMVQALLGLEKRSDTKNGKKRHWVTPVINVAQSPIAMLAGGAAVQSLSASGAPVEIAAGTPDLTDGADVVEAEVVSDEELELRDKLWSDAVQFNLDPERFIQAVNRQAKGDLASMQKCHEQIVAGTREPLAFKSNGAIDWAVST